MKTFVKHLLDLRYRSQRSLCMSLVITTSHDGVVYVVQMQKMRHRGLTSS